MKTLSLFRSLTGVALFCAGALTLCATIGVETPQQAAFPEIFVVNTTFDATTGADDAFPGDGQCETAVNNGVCTLRAAIEETNAHAGSDGIFFDIPTTDPGYSNGTWTINLSKALPDISDAVNISGPGADKLTINGGNAFRVFNVTTTGTVSFSHLSIANGNAVSNNGGGIQNASIGTVNVTNCTLSGNAANNGGGIYNATTGTVNVSNSTLSDNSANGPSQLPSGGGIYNPSGTITVTDSTLINNRALRISGSQSFGSGGGIYNDVNGKLNVVGSTFSSNSAGVAPNINIASGGGGGIANFPGSFGNSTTMNITNSTFSGNASPGGGAIFTNGAFGGPRANITNSTISGNSAVGLAGGILNGDSDLFVKSTVIANNTGASSSPDVHGSFASQGFNLIGKTDGSTGFTAATDLTGTNAAPLNPKLGLLRYNGGPTDTMALLSGSPAIDKGTSAGLTGTLTTDQRGVGYKRTINKSVANATGGDGTDIGAFELGAQIKAVSSKRHGSAGTFNIKLPLFGPKLGVECRKGGSSGVFTVILTFPSAVTVSDATVTPDPATSGATASVSSFSVSGSKLTVNLTGVSQAQTITVHLLSVSDGTNTNDVSVPMGVLLCDTDNNRSVTSNDVSLTQSKVGQAISTSNFREDVNLDGVINSTDVNLVQSKVGTKLP
jgi:hypothetical protein